MVSAGSAFFLVRRYRIGYPDDVNPRPDRHTIPAGDWFKISA
jgi:hypothetical protein